eukprot:scaffold65577_cov27-Prasinocladus_malaysianus.AAC.1
MRPLSIAHAVGNRVIALAGVDRLAFGATTGGSTHTQDNVPDCIVLTTLRIARSTAHRCVVSDLSNDL